MPKRTTKTPLPPASPLPNLTSCSCLHLSRSRLIGRAPQINNQSSIINSEDPLMPRPPLVSCLLSPVFCSSLLSRPACRLCSCLLSLVLFHPLFLPALLVPCALLPFVSSCLSGCDSIMQNKPNFQNPKINATSCRKRTYADFPPRSARKKQTQTNPIPPTQYARRNTRYASRLPLGGDTLHAIRPMWRRAVLRCIMMCWKQCQSVLIPVGPWVRVKKTESVSLS